MTWQSWVSIATGLFGGLGLFLFGMKLMSDGLQKVAGENLKKLLEKLTANRYIGAGVGTAVTMLIQSSSATTVMVIGFVNANLMSLTQALSVIFGANIGTTLTAQIIAFKITAAALPAIGIGCVMYMFVKNTRAQYYGEVILGFGLLFFGMLIMTDNLAPLKNSQELKNLFVHFSTNPILGVLAGMLITTVVQSSSATIGITMALATNGLVDYTGAAALVLGDNIGTTVTANLAAIGGSRVAKQAAFGHFLFNVFGVCYMLVLLRPFLSFVDYITPGSPLLMENGAYPYVARHIANVHSLFNIVNALICLPIMHHIAKFIQFVIRSDGSTQSYKYTHLSDAMLKTPDIALAQARSEVTRMSQIAMEQLAVTEQALRDGSKSLDKVSEYEETLDGYKIEIMAFLELLSGKSLSAKSVRSMEDLRIAASNLEDIGDHAQKIMRYAEKIINKKMKLSPAARKELEELFNIVMDFTGKTFTCFSTHKEQTEEEMLMEDSIDKLHKQFKKNHVNRLKRGLCSPTAGMLFVDILNALEKIADYSFTVAQLNAKSSAAG